MRALAGFVVGSLSLTAVGCIPPVWLFDDDDGPPPTYYYDDDSWEQPDNPSVPTIHSLNLPDWPPLGPESSLSVTVSDVESVRLEFQFAKYTERLLAAGTSTTEVTGIELGEGLGDLSITAVNSSGGRAGVDVNDLLIDLSEPEITLGATALRHGVDSMFEFWVSDAWVLGEVELTVGDLTVKHDFEDGYPSTLGVEYDYSLVQFPTTAFQAGKQSAEIRVVDAAGNATVNFFELTLDGQAPDVDLLSPTQGTVIDGPFSVVATAVDDMEGQIWIEASINGTPVGNAPGPEALIQVDPSEFTTGPAELAVVAYDEVGNRSEPVTIGITIE